MNIISGVLRHMCVKEGEGVADKAGQVPLPYSIYTS